MITDVRKEEQNKLDSIFASSGYSLKPLDQGRSQQKWTKGGLANRQATHTCPLCKKVGHTKHTCPDVASGIIPKEEFNRPKYPTGIPKASMIKASANDPNAMLGPDGYVIPKIDS